MKIFDMHIHGNNAEPKPAELLAQMEEAGISGACIFSNRPIRCFEDRGTTLEERLNELHAWCKGYEDRLFPDFPLKHRVH